MITPPYEGTSRHNSNMNCMSERAGQTNQPITEQEVGNVDDAIYHRRGCKDSLILEHCQLVLLFMNMPFSQFLATRQ